MLAARQQPWCARLQSLFHVLLLLACLLATGFTTHGAWSDETAITISEKVLAGAERRYGPDARKRLLAWQSLLGSPAAREAELSKLKLVNDFFNQIPFLSDIEHWGKEDYWATPAEMLASNGGDCEDFSIAKYFTLVSLGVPVDKLKITYVRARTNNPVTEAHMVLTYYATASAMPLVLDNLIPDIKPASQRPDLTPVYSFNGAGLWLAKERGDGKPVAGGSSNIGFWRDLKQRMGNEFQ
ncbi:MAG: transglutaminase-like cysteine peptidase [Janthinobacterium lividum]